MDQLNNLENELKQLSGIELPEGNNGDSVNPEQMDKVDLIRKHLP